ncbi:MAG: hypothetical protein GVY16_00345 [Planctomycetes bacterium]|nr:hypothetical protein [Planctomycetota bacterium]
MKKCTSANRQNLNDMETIDCSTVDRGIMLIPLDRPTGEAAIASGRDLHGRVHVW